MYRHYIVALVCFASAFILSVAHAQQLRSPVDIPIYLSGSFGELRNNHFHSGIDFKTQGVIGKDIRSVNDGYISRISVSPYGYGLALYINHPDSTTTVYAHLSQFNDSIARYVLSKQYELESFRIDVSLSPEEIPVKKGELIALSGNTGSSGGPHLHFEVRDTRTEEPFDPLPFYQTRISDTQPPRIQSVMIYPMEGKGIVNGGTTNKRVAVTSNPKGGQTLSGKLDAWGEIGFAVKAYDYMNETGNVYGVKEITLQADSTVLFHSNLTRYAFDETRYLNSFTDFEEWRNKQSFYMKSFIEPGNRLRFIEASDRGILTISEPRVYHLTYTLADAFGNTAILRFDITGKPQDIPAADTTGTELFPYYADNRFGAKGVRLFIPRGNLYKDLNFRYTVQEDTISFAALHTLHNKQVPLHASARLSLKIQRDTLNIPSQYGIIKYTGTRLAWVGGSYRDGWIDANIRELGTYTVGADCTPPKITPVRPEQWQKTRTFTFRITDDLSGIEHYKGTIDGRFVLFAPSEKSSVISYTIDPKQVAPGEHLLELSVTDACGNSNLYSYKIRL